jgi:hypothetical protein
MQVRGLIRDADMIVADGSSPGPGHDFNRIEEMK